MLIQKKRITAADDLPPVDDTIVEGPDAGEPAAGDVDVAPEATELLFETEDVAELLAQATGEPVEVETDDETEDVIFRVGDSELVASPEGNEEIVEAYVPKKKKPVQASTSTKRRPGTKVVRKLPRK